MKKYLKSALALLLAAALCLGFAGCYSENNTWSAKYGDETISIGTYIYFLNTAYARAASMVNSDQEVLKSTIEGKPAEEWIREQAKQSIQTYCYYQEQLNALGITLSEEDEANVNDLTEYAWSIYRTMFEEIGVSEDSLKTSYARNAVLGDKLMQALYGEGGAQALAEGELEDYFTENYSRYEYFYAVMTRTDEEGATVDLGENDKQMRVDQLEQYAKQINAGVLTTEEAAQRYANLFSEEEEAESTYVSPVTILTDNMGTVFSDALAEADENEAVVADSSENYYYVIRKLPVREYYDEYVADEDQAFDLLYGYKGEDFEAYVKEQSASVSGIEWNEKAMNRIKISKLVDDGNRNGTVSSAVEDTSSTASTVSSESGEE